MTKTLIIFCILFFSNYSFGQQNVHKGKIITDNGELDGYISVNNFAETPQTFKFSNSINGHFTTVNDVIHRVLFEDGRIFELYLIKTSVLSNEYSNRIKTDYGKPAVFSAYLQLLISGRYKLYQFIDRFAFPHFFYSKAGDSTVNELVYRPYKEGNGIYYDKTYISQISFLANQYCKKNTGVYFETMSYTTASMVKAFKKINLCESGKLIDHTTQNKWKVNPGLVVGIASTNPDPDRKNGTDWERVTHLIYGATFTFSQLGLNNFTLGVDALYTYYKASTGSYPTGAIQASQNITSQQGTVSPFIRFYISSKNKNRFYVDSGIRFGIFMDTDFTTDYSTGYSVKKEIANPISLFVAPGLQFNHFTVQPIYSYSFARTVAPTIALQGKFMFKRMFQN